jgi:hypothetical protein
MQKKNMKEDLSSFLLNKHFGPFQIKGVKNTEEKTYLGYDKIILVLDDDTEKTLPIEDLRFIATVEKSNLTELREKRVIPVVKKLLTILTESELGNSDLHYAIDMKLGESIKMASDCAQEVLFGKPKEEVSLMDLEKVLRRQKKKSANNK